MLNVTVHVLVHAFIHFKYLTGVYIGQKLESNAELKQAGWSSLSDGIILHSFIRLFLYLVAAVGQAA